MQSGSIHQRKSKQSFKRKELVGKLDPTCLRTFKAAADSAKLRGNPYVELAHWIEQLVLSERSDVQLILAEAGAEAGRLAGDMARALDRLPRGATAIEEFSDHIFHAIQEAWSLATLEFGTDEVRSGHVLLACLKVPALEALVSKISAEFDKVDADDIAARFDDIVSASLENHAEEPAGEKPRRASAADSALARYATDLTQRARDGKIDPVVGRDPEIRQIIDVLMRRRQNNPILTGEAGVGKTAVVEGFALRIARGDVPPPLRDIGLHMLDVGLMQAGASVKGEFEKRLKSVIDEVQSSETPVILFIDEAHTLIGAGGAAGTGDAANLLKPALARGELRTIAATTWAEYKQHIEKDPALTRRFQVVRVEEPSEAAAVLMLRGVAGVLEKHHEVQILDEAIEAAVSLSHRYIPARQLPDKAISLLDTACARVAISQHATPAEVEDILRRKQALEVESAIIGREAAIGMDVAERQARVDEGIAEAEGLQQAAEARWQREKELVGEILELARATSWRRPRARRRPGAAGSDAGGRSGRGWKPRHRGAGGGGARRRSPDDRKRPGQPRRGPGKASRTHGALTEAQGETPLILPSVDRNAVAAVVQDWTGIPTGGCSPARRKRRSGSPRRSRSGSSARIMPWR